MLSINQFRLHHPVPRLIFPLIFTCHSAPTAASWWCFMFMVCPIPFRLSLLASRHRSFIVKHQFLLCPVLQFSHLNHFLSEQNMQHNINSTLYVRWSRRQSKSHTEHACCLFPSRFLSIIYTCRAKKHPKPQVVQFFSVDGWRIRETAFFTVIQSLLQFSSVQ